MKLTTLLLSFSLCLAYSAKAQEAAVSIPEFKNKVYYVKKDNTLAEIENADLQSDMKTGMTSAKIFYRVPGTASPVKKSGLPSCRFVVKLEDGVDPESVVELLKYEIDKKSRFVQVGSVVMGSFKTVEIPKQKLNFNKIEPGVYVITTKEALPGGEYVFMINRPTPGITASASTKGFAFEVGTE